MSLDKDALQFIIRKTVWSAVGLQEAKSDEEGLRKCIRPVLSAQGALATMSMRASVKLEVEINIAEGTINKHEIEERVRKEAILALFADRKIPAGQAARELGLGRLEFMELLKPRGIP